jgi:hypothetical protein
MKPKVLNILIASLFFWSGALAQIPVEVFGGHEKTTVDIIFFKCGLSANLNHFSSHVWFYGGLLLQSS